MRHKGKIKSWNNEKAYGFVSPFVEGRDVFIHLKAFANRSRTPNVGDVITYTLAQDQQGRACAEGAVFAGEKPPKPQQEHSFFTTVFVAGFAVIAAISALTGKTPVWLPGLYCLMSGITFLVYWRDKSAAKKGHRRTPESTLHLLALAGGWPGAMLAQRKLRHKSKKQDFRFVFWMTVLLNCGAFVWLHSEGGAALQRSILGV